MMQLRTNSLNVNSVRRETDGGREFLVAEDVTIGREARLDGGYVPADAWRASVEKWAGEPLPIGHPTSTSGEFVSAHNADVQNNVVVGELRNPSFNSGVNGIDADLYVDIQKAQSVGEYGERVLEILRNGESMDVSTAYHADDGNPAEYPDVPHDEISVNLRPDHLALLPDDLSPGRLTVDDHNVGVEPSPGVISAGTTSSGSPAMAANTTTSTFCVNAADADSVSVGVEPDDESESDTTDTDDGEADESNAEMPAVGQQVRWPAGPETTRYGVVTGDAGISGSGMAVTIWKQADGGWQRTNQTASVDPETTTHLQQFPPTAMNSKGDGPVRVNYLDSPRTPDYSGTTTGEWDAPSLNDYIDAFVTDDEDVDRVADLSQEAKRTIASKTLLGDPEAEDAENLRSFPVVDTDNNLHEGALDAVITFAPQAEYLTEDEAEALQNKARSMLEDEFDRDIDTNAADDGGDQDIAAGAGDDDPETGSLLSRARDLLTRAVSSGTGGSERGGVSDDPDVNEGPDPALADVLSDSDAPRAESDDLAAVLERGEDHDDGDEDEPTQNTISTLDQSMTNLSDTDYEQLAANSEYSVDELHDDPEATIKVLREQALATNADDDEEGEDGGDGDASDDDVDTQESGSDPEGEDGDSADVEDDVDIDIEAQSDIAEIVQEAIRAETSDLREDVAELKANQNKREETRRENLAADIKANSSELPDAAVDQMDLETLEETHESVMANSQPASAGTDFGALEGPAATLGTNADDDEEPDMETSGSFADYVDTDD